MAGQDPQRLALKRRGLRSQVRRLLRQVARPLPELLGPLVEPDGLIEQHLGGLLVREDFSYCHGFSFLVRRRRSSLP
jgi:hypothetical protein